MDYEKSLVDEARARAAWLKNVYSASNPPPARPAVGRGEWLTRLLLVVMCGAALGVSAAHTIPMFSQLTDAPPAISWAVGVLGFATIEISLILFAFLSTRRHYLRKLKAPPINTGVYLKGGLLLAFTIALTTNVYSTVKSTGYRNTAAPLQQQVSLVSTALTDAPPAAAPDLVTVLVAALLGVSAPAMAYLAGESLAMLEVERHFDNKSLLAEYDEALSSWRQNAAAAWLRASTRGRYSLTEHSQPAPDVRTVRSVHSVNSEQVNTANTANGYSKNMNARAIIQQFLEQNPGMIDNPLSDLTAAIVQQTGVAVGRTSVHNVRQYMKKGN